MHASIQRCLFDAEWHKRNDYKVEVEVEVDVEKND